MAIRPLQTEKELQAKIARGDRHAFTLFYNAYYPVIFGFARHLLHSEELALDIVQESMLHIWKLGRQLEKVNNLESYLKVFARRRAVDLLRHRAVALKAERILGSTWTEDHNDTEEAILLREGRKILEEGIQLLPKQQRQVYQLCQQEGLKYEEAAQQMGISTGTVKTHLKLAMRFLREHIKNNNDIAILLVFFKLL
ncbi:RNA polymerase sigma factor [Pedobacter sp. GR22-6]|uniref:RNA polymerase sigma factor n=1 Tax=Pedobacter sp. GR22-6 TaxID=3127957 RepID=UPI00307DF548